MLGGTAFALGAAFAAIAWLGELHDHARSFVLLFVGASAAYGLAVAWVVRRRPAGRWVLWLIVAAAVGFRLLLLPTAPTLSTDVCRYVWDGRLSAAGVSPYRYLPQAPELARFRSDWLYSCLNHPDWHTIYPPGAQLLFWGVVRWLSDDIVVAKAVLVAFDLLTLALVAGWLAAIGRPASWALLYAWHPLVVVEVAGSGHLDAVVLATSAAALWAASRGRETWAGALIGAATLVKLYPLILVAAVVRRRPVQTLAACAVVIGAGYGLFAREGPAVLGSLGRYVAQEQFNPGLRALLELPLVPFGPGGRYAARVLSLVGLAGLASVVAFRARQAPVEQRALWVVGAYLLATPSLFPWYALWLVPILAAAPAWPWIHLSCAVSLTYLIFAEPVWHIPRWVTAVEFVPLALGLALAIARGRPGWRGGADVRPDASDGARRGQDRTRPAASPAATSRSARPVGLSP